MAYKNFRGSVGITPEDEHGRRRANTRAENLRGAGFKVDELTPYHFRVNDRLDVYHVGQCWHDIKLNKRGMWYKPMSMENFVKKYFSEL